MIVKKINNFFFGFLVNEIKLEFKCIGYICIICIFFNCFCKM